MTLGQPRGNQLIIFPRLYITQAYIDIIYELQAILHCTGIKVYVVVLHRLVLHYTLNTELTASLRSIIDVFTAKPLNMPIMLTFVLLRFTAVVRRFYLITNPHCSGEFNAQQQPGGCV